MYNLAHQVVADFTGTDLRSNAVKLTQNGSEALNKLANRFAFRDGNDYFEI